jgi:putative heme iron utilization protein
MDAESFRLLPRLIRNHRVASLGTQREGLPYVSLITYAPADDLGSLFIHVSRLAHHTQDLLQDARCTVLIAETDDGSHDPQALARVTLLGDARPVEQDDPTYESARRLYLRKYPEAEFLFQLGDFSLYRITISTGRFVAGFGKAYSISRHDLLRSADLAP